MSETRTLDEQRAAHAEEAAKAVPPPRRDEFGAQLAKLPARIRAAGLGQALAFLHARGHSPELLGALDDWAWKQRPAADQDKASLLDRLMHGDGAFQRWATAEVLAYLLCLTRFHDGTES